MSRLVMCETCKAPVFVGVAHEHRPPMTVADAKAEIIARLDEMAAQGLVLVLPPGTEMEWVSIDSIEIVGTVAPDGDET